MMLLLILLRFDVGKTTWTADCPKLPSAWLMSRQLGTRKATTGLLPEGTHYRVGDMLL